MGKKAKKKITCTVTFTEGAIDRITDAFIELYFDIKNGIHEGPLLDDKKEDTKEPA